MKKLVVAGIVATGVAAVGYLVCRGTKKMMSKFNRCDCDCDCYHSDCEKPVDNKSEDNCTCVCHDGDFEECKEESCGCECHDEQTESEPTAHEEETKTDTDVTTKPE